MKSFDCRAGYESGLAGEFSIKSTDKIRIIGTNESSLREAEAVKLNMKVFLRLQDFCQNKIDMTSERRVTFSRRMLTFVRYNGTVDGAGNEQS